MTNIDKITILFDLTWEFTPSNFSHSAVNVGLTQGTYAVMESEEEVVMVCARLTGLIARDVNVRLSTTSNTAEEGSDFTSLIGDVRTFLPFLQSDVCWPISITNDSHVEGTEDFLVSLFTDDTGVILNPNMAKVVIVEEDCKHYRLVIPSQCNMLIMTIIHT